MPSITKSIDMPTLSDRDMELLISALRCAEGGFPKVDWKKFAEMAGYKNAASASVSFAGVKKKVMGEAGSAKPTPNKSTPSKRKQATEATATGDDADESPTKKAKTSSKKAVNKEQDIKDESGNDEGTAFI
ncbi:hypothetical protein LA080_011718 [Diaporthe eres]|uniref:Uncharacterized protein n=1 Tax=Diaporthe vaccinii TaxID=105482 RepID=A0ABR4FCC8_9PEZI|nr:hypothetical protein LA080_011718 [Diaporthe eres]